MKSVAVAFDEIENSYELQFVKFDSNLWWKIFFSSKFCWRPFWTKLILIFASVAIFCCNCSKIDWTHTYSLTIVCSSKTISTYPIRTKRGGGREAKFDLNFEIKYVNYLSFLKSIFDIIPPTQKIASINENLWHHSWRLTMRAPNENFNYDSAHSWLL